MLFGWSFVTNRGKMSPSLTPCFFQSPDYYRFVPVLICETENLGLVLGILAGIIEVKGPETGSSGVSVRVSLRPRYPPVPDRG